MHAVSSYRGSRPTNTHTHTHTLTDRGDYNTLLRSFASARRLTIYREQKRRDVPIAQCKTLFFYAGLFLIGINFESKLKSDCQQCGISALLLDIDIVRFNRRKLGVDGRNNFAR